MIPINDIRQFKKSEMISINDLAEMVNDLAHEKGFYDTIRTLDQMIQDFCNNEHDEISELHEAWRNDTLFSLCDKSKSMSELGIIPVTYLEEELADIIIRALDTARELNINIERAILSKHEYNKHRSYRHGGKKS